MAQKSKSKKRAASKSKPAKLTEKGLKISGISGYFGKKKTTKPKTTKTVIVDEREQPRRIEVYTTSDLILSEVTLPSPCSISIKVIRDSVILQVGPRDWQWSRETGELIASGTALTEDAKATEFKDPDPDAQPVEGVVESDIEKFEDEDVRLGEELPEETSESREHLTDPNSVDDEKVG